MVSKTYVLFEKVVLKVPSNPQKTNLNVELVIENATVFKFYFDDESLVDFLITML